MSQPLLASVCVKKNRLRTYGTNVYLKDKQEFEIELFNPTSKNRLAKIFVNGDEISGSGLVLRPGQRIYLERYITTPRKFRFDTYTVDGSPESIKATESNGLVEVYFYDEEVAPPVVYEPPPASISLDFYGTCHDSGIDIGDIVYSSGGGHPAGISGTPLTFTSGGTGTVSGYAGAGSGSVSCFTSTTTDSGLTTGGTVKLGGSLMSTTTISPGLFVGKPKDEKRSLKRKETGRIEKGSASSQAFVDFIGTFQDYWIASAIIKILPISAKVNEASDLSTYCTNCGTKNKSGKYKYCPSCGSKY